MLLISKPTTRSAVPGKNDLILLYIHEISQDMLYSTVHSNNYMQHKKKDAMGAKVNDSKLTITRRRGTRPTIPRVLGHGCFD